MSRRKTRLIIDSEYTRESVKVPSLKITRTRAFINNYCNKRDRFEFLVKPVYSSDAGLGGFGRHTYISPSSHSLFTHTKIQCYFFRHVHPQWLLWYSQRFRFYYFNIIEIWEIKIKKIFFIQTNDYKKNSWRPVVNDRGWTLAGEIVFEFVTEKKKKWDSISPPVVVNVVRARKAVHADQQCVGGWCKTVLTNTNIPSPPSLPPAAMSSSPPEFLLLFFFLSRYRRCYTCNHVSPGLAFLLVISCK